MDDMQYNVLIVSKEDSTKILIEQSLLNTHDCIFTTNDCENIDSAIEQSIIGELDCIILNLETKYGISQNELEKIYILCQHCPTIALIDHPDSILEEELFENGVSECLLKGSSLWERLAPHLFHAIQGWNNARKALAWSKNRGRFIEYIPTASVLISENGTITDFNSAAEKLLKISSKETFGCDFTKLLLPEIGQTVFGELLNEVKFSGKTESLKTSLYVREKLVEFTVRLKHQCDDDKLGFFILLIEPILPETAGKPRHIIPIKSKTFKYPRKVTAILFDEDSINQVIMSSHFEKLDIFLDGAWNTNELESKIMERKYDIYLVDEMTANDSLAETTQAILESNPQAKLVLIRNNDSDEPVSADFDEIVSKPINHAQTVKIVSKLTHHIAEPADSEISGLVKNMLDNTEIQKLDEDEIQGQVSGIVENLKHLVDRIAKASNEANIDMLRELATDLRSSCNSEEDIKNKASINALEHLVLSLITAKQIEQMRISAEKFHSL